MQADCLIILVRGTTRLARGNKRSQSVEFKTYMCVICGFVYEEEKGMPDAGLPPGTRWQDVPDTWTCPDCGAGKDDFELIEI